ncbi:MAG: prepilin-type N-terminal cleavage/methylation domain-containing protein [Planctomycetota bacterium]
MNFYAGNQRGRQAFTLVELLVVIGIIALLIAILLPSLQAARNASKSVKCLSNMRQLAIAHTMYVSENGGYFVQPGLGHSGASTAAPTLFDPAQSTVPDDGTGHADEQGAWINTMRPYFTTTVLLRSPLDFSPHWEGEGLPVREDDGEPVWRRTSYGINTYLTGLVTDESGAPLYRRITQVKQSSATVHFLIMAYTGAFAAADHPHSESWGVPGFEDGAPFNASKEIQMNAHGGEVGDWQARSAYSFVDGHAEVTTFRDLWIGTEFDPSAPSLADRYKFINNFNPATAR